MKQRLLCNTLDLGIDSFLTYFTWALPLIHFICELIPFFDTVGFVPLFFWCWIVFISFVPLTFRNASIGMMITGVRIVDENGRCPSSKYILLRSCSIIPNMIEYIKLMLSGEDINGVGLTSSGTQIMSRRDIDEKIKQTENRILPRYAPISMQAKIPHSYAVPILKILIALLALPTSIIIAGVLLGLIHQAVENGIEIPYVFEYILEIVCVPISFISAILI